MKSTSCDCESACGSTMYGQTWHTCQREPGHTGPHTCHTRFRQKLKKGDIVWREGDEE